MWASELTAVNNTTRTLDSCSEVGFGAFFGPGFKSRVKQIIINNYVVAVSFVATLASTIFLLREKLVELLLLFYRREIGAHGLGGCYSVRFCRKVGASSHLDRRLLIKCCVRVLHLGSTFFQSTPNICQNFNPSYPRMQCCKGETK